MAHHRRLPRQGGREPEEGDGLIRHGRSQCDFSTGGGTLPDYLGMVHEMVSPGHVTGRFKVEKHHMAPNGFLHAASVIALVDSACGFGAMGAMPEGGTGFTTIELKTNFLGTTRDGTVTCDARMIHGGRTTQVWDATATHAESGKVIALFRCTQMILYPR